jgi:hypothetical protein
MWLMAAISGAVDAADLPGEFIIRTYVKNTLLSAHDAANVEPMLSSPLRRRPRAAASGSS